MMIWIFIALFFLILILLARINYKINNDFKIETSWFALALTPVFIWLLATGQLQEKLKKLSSELSKADIEEIKGFGFGIKMEKATSQPVSLKLDGNKIEPKQISRDQKGGLRKIKNFKRNRVAAITIELEKRGYYNNGAIKKYLEELTPLSFFKYVIFEGKLGEFRGIISGTQLLDEMQSGNINLVKLIESADVSEINGTSSIMVSSGTSKLEALQVMDEHELSEVAVVDGSNSFMGVVERNKITSSIVVELASLSKKTS